MENSDGHAEQDARQRLYRSLLRKFWFAAIVSFPVIYFSYQSIFPGVPEKRSAGRLTRCIATGISSTSAGKPRSAVC